ncbi:hypothetical protein J6590_076621 [Homalodisca vitripennis]|nr:hypothetical protein J6590_076621 [Homalodisca vitripennis]
MIFSKAEIIKNNGTIIAFKMTTTTSTASTPTLNSSGNVNISGFFTDEEHEDIGFTELQTVGIACVATLIPLALTLFAVFGLRMVWKNWRGESEERTLRRTDSSDPNKSSHLLLPDEKPSSVHYN